MEATLDATTLDEGRIGEIRRVLSRHPQPGVRVTKLGRVPLKEPDPLRHFGHTAGAMYTTAESISHMLTLLTTDGLWQGKPFLSKESIAAMKTPQASYGAVSPGMHYGLGLILFEDKRLPGCVLAGHQGFAYGCVDGAFVDLNSGRQVIQLNGGASEARDGRLGLLNRDVLRWALGKEMPQWK